MRGLTGLSALVLVGCACNGGKDEGAGTCSAGAGIDEVAIEDTEIGMVKRLTWTECSATDVTVAFGPEGDCAKYSTNTVPSSDGEIILIGLPPSISACYTVEAGGTHEGTFETGPPPAGISLPTVSVNDGGDEPFLIASLILPPVQWAIDRDGEVVWANVLGDDRQTTDIHHSADKTGFHYNDYALDHSVDDSYARYVGYDGVPQQDIRTIDGHHAYEVFDDGRVVYLAVDVRPLTYLDDDGIEVTGDVVGDKLVEIDAQGNELRTIWNAWDDFEKFPLVQTDIDNTPFYPQGEDWTHANFVQYVPSRDSWLFSFRNVNSVIEISDADGSWMRSVGEFGEYAIDGWPDWEQIIGHPHNAHATDDDTWVILTMPDHGNEESRILELAFDDVAKTATIVWDYGTGLGIDAKVEGAGDRLPNGNTLVNWGAGGVIQEVTPDQTVIWEASFNVGSFAGHVHAIDGFYP